MHAPDGFIDGPTSLAMGAVAAAGLAVCVRGARAELDERAAPRAGLAAAFVFAAQMINFPVAGGTSGHLLGGTLAAILVGPYTGALCVSVVLIVQSLLFADGGLTALGTNITTMALITTLVGYPLFRLLLRVLPRSRAGAAIAAFVAATVSVPCAALAFVAVYAVGGTASIPIGTFLTAMGAVHLLIGIGEGVITALTVSAVMAARPDLVYGVRDRLAVPELRTRPAPATGPGEG